LKRKELLKNEWVKTGILLAIVLVAFFSVWFGVRYALDTGYPLLAVASGSMVPTLNVGDLIIVQGISNFSAIYAHPLNGTIIVFHTYLPGGPMLLNVASDELIVHRVINKTRRYDSSLGRWVWYFSTKGDANSIPDTWDPAPYGYSSGVPDYYVVGKVVGNVPWIGYVPLDIRTTEGLETIIVLIIIVVLAEYVYSSVKEKKRPPIEAQS
jgi:signal peptidase